jgi:hypothetical protein
MFTFCKLFECNNKRGGMQGRIENGGIPSVTDGEKCHSGRIFFQFNTVLDNKKDAYSMTR